MGLGEGAPHGLGVETERGAGDWVGHDLDPDRPQPRQHEPGQDAAVRVARDQHHVPGLPDASGTGPDSRAWIHPSRTGTRRLPRGRAAQSLGLPQHSPGQLDGVEPAVEGHVGVKEPTEVGVQQVPPALVPRDRERARDRTPRTAATPASAVRRPPSPGSSAQWGRSLPCVEAGSWLTRLILPHRQAPGVRAAEDHERSPSRSAGDGRSRRAPAGWRAPGRPRASGRR